MSIDFRRLSREDKIKAIDNVLKEVNGKEYLAHLINGSSLDIYGWFSILGANEGFDYWINIANEQKK
jgi:hypothetical protein